MPRALKSCSTNKGSLKLRQKKLFKKFRNNPRLWIEKCLKVVDSKGKELDFIFNNVQAEYYDELIRLYWKPYKTLKNGEVVYRFQGIREINLKGRQFGLSTLICALLMHDTIFWGNTKTYIFCQDAPKSKEMLRDKVKNVWDAIEPDPLLVMPRTTVYNETVVRFTTKSVIQALTPGSSEGSARKAGRSITVRNALLSEMAEWEDAETLWQGLAAAVEDETTNVFVESSPNPKKSGPFFRSLYDEGKLPGSIWRSRFWGWYKFTKYRAKFESEEHLANFRESITDEELVLRELYGLDEEQLLWRRNKISFLGGGKKGTEKFICEYPSNEREGFESKDEELFFNDVDVDVRRVLAQPEDPIEGRMYCIACDPAKGKGGDYSVIKAADPTTRADVFKWSSNHFSIRRLHWKVYETFLKYPGPVGIENNGMGEIVVGMARQIRDEFFQKMLYTSSRGDDGFRTGDNRGQMLYDLREELQLAVKAYGNLTEENDLPEIAQGYRLIDEETVAEMDYFADSGDGKYEAKPGKHDDHILTSAIMVQLLRLAPKYRKRFEKYYPDREKFKVRIGIDTSEDEE